VGVLVKVGEKIPLNCQLADRVSDKFVKAYLFDKLGAPLTPASVNLSHVANGLFLDTTVDMPDIASVIAQYVVFEDAGYLVPHDEHDAVTDMFERDEIDAAIDQLLIAARKTDMEMKLYEALSFTAEVDDSDDSPTASVESASTLTATVQDGQNVSGEVIENEDFEGKID